MIRIREALAAALYGTLVVAGVAGKGLPHGYRRSPVTALLDPRNNRVLWIVNALDTPDLDPKSLGLIRSSVVTLDEQSAEDRKKGRLDLSHFDLLEDRPSGDLILTYPRSHHHYQSREFVELRLKLSPK